MKIDNISIFNILIYLIRMEIAFIYHVHNHQIPYNEIMYTNILKNIQLTILVVLNKIGTIFHIMNK